jgi:hypothetical protein
MDYNLPDTLVLKIEEYEEYKVENKLIDTTLYILYDTRAKRYVIRGKRRLSSSLEFQPYSFESELACDLADFIELIICSKNTISYSLYNYDNLPNESNEITYDFFNAYDDRAYEISGYDNQKFKRRVVLKYLRSLRNVFNYY